MLINASPLSLDAESYAKTFVRLSVLRKLAQGGRQQVSAHGEDAVK